MLFTKFGVMIFSALQAMALNCGAKSLTNQQVVKFIEPRGYDRVHFIGRLSAHNCNGKSACCYVTGQCLNIGEARAEGWEGAICLSARV